MKSLSFLLFFLSIFYLLFTIYSPLSVQAAPLEAKDIQLNTWQQVDVLDVGCSGTCQVMGVNLCRPDRKCVNYNTGGSLVMGEGPTGGAVGAVSGLISQLYQPPASTIQYIAYLKGNLGLATPAYAQGTGWTGLSPILPLWRVFRDAAYFLFVFFFIIVGLLIMFRVRVSPQAVATLQNSLPRLLVTLILITLSYAIVGLMVDLMYVFMSFFTALFKGSGIAVGDLDQYYGDNIIKIFFRFERLGGAAIGGPAGVIGSIVEGIFSGKSLGGWSFITAILAFLILAVAVLWALFRLFFILLKAYIWVLVLLIFAPFQLLLGALPGTGATFGFSGWIRSLLANLAVFPATLVMFLLASFLIQQRELFSSGGGEGGWVAPFIGSGYGPSDIIGLVALGIILVTPNVAQMMNDTFKPPPFPYGAAIGQAIGAGPAIGGGVSRRFGAAMPRHFERWDWRRAITG